jgi:hypothetical protein
MASKAERPIPPIKLSRFIIICINWAAQGYIRQTEFFLYSARDKEAVRRCQELGYEFPEVTGWIRAHKNDFELAKSMDSRSAASLSAVRTTTFTKSSKNAPRSDEDNLAIVKSAIEVASVALPF